MPTIKDILSPIDPVMAKLVVSDESAEEFFEQPTSYLERNFPQLTDRERSYLVISTIIQFANFSEDSPIHEILASIVIKYAEYSGATPKQLEEIGRTRFNWSQPPQSE